MNTPRRPLVLLILSIAALGACFAAAYALWAWGGEMEESETSTPLATSDEHARLSLD